MLFEGAGTTGHGGNPNAELFGNLALRQAGGQQFENLQALADLQQLGRGQQVAEQLFEAVRITGRQQVFDQFPLVVFIHSVARCIHVLVHYHKSRQVQARCRRCFHGGACVQCRFASGAVGPGLSGGSSRNAVDDRQLRLLYL